MTFIVVLVAMYLITNNPAIAIGVAWLVWTVMQPTTTDPDKARGEVDSDGNFGE